MATLGEWLSRLFGIGKGRKSRSSRREFVAGSDVSRSGPATGHKTSADDSLEVLDPDLDHLSEAARAAATRLWQQVMRGVVELPSLPDIALRISNKVNDPDASVEDVVSLIRIDPAVTSKLVQIANSALYTGFDPVSNPSQAVTRMGLRTTRDVVISISLKSLFTSDDPALRQRMRALWDHSTLVAAVSAVLARRYTGLDPEQAMMAGLLHDVGTMAIINAYSKERPDRRFPEQELDAVIAGLREPIGASLIRSWGLGPELARATSAEQFQVAEPGLPALADLMRIAHVHAFAGTAEMGRLPPINTIASLNKLGLHSGGADRTIDELKEARAEISAIRSLLAS